MNNSDFKTTLLVDQAPIEAFNAINNPRARWSRQIEGITDKENEVFNYHYKDVHICSMKITEFIPDKKIVWHVLENHFNFTKDKTEWKNTNIIFKISRLGDKTQVEFTHQGLTPTYECFDICKNAWTTYIQESLFNLISTGHGQPNPIEEVVNEAAEKAAKL